jgi:WD40 repeat protein/HEAT repeat protein
MPLFTSEAPPCPVRIWEAAGGQENRLFPGQVISAALSPTAPHLALAGKEGHQVRICDAVTGEGLGVLAEFPKAQVSALDWSPDGGSLALALFRRDFTATSYNVLDEVRIFDTATGEERLGLGAIGGQVADVRFTGGGRSVVVACDDGRVTIRDAHSGKEMASIPGGRQGLSRIALSPDGKRLARVAVYDRILDLWDASTGEQLLDLVGITGRCWGLGFSSDGRLLAAGSGKEVVLFDVETGEELSRLGGFFEAVRAVAFPPGENDRLAVVDGKAVKLMELAGGQEVLAFRGSFTGLAFSRDGQLLIAGEENTGLKLWDARPPHRVVVTAAKPVASPPLKPSDVIPADLRLESVRSAIRKGTEQMNKGDPGAALLWSVEALKVESDRERQAALRLRIGLLLQEMPNLRPLAPEGKQPADFVADKVSALPRTVDRCDPWQDWAYRFTVSADGRRVARWFQPLDTRSADAERKAGRSPYRLEVFDSATGQPAGPALPVPGLFDPGQVALSPDGRRVATFAISSRPDREEKGIRDLHVWAVQTGRQVSAALCPEAPITNRLGTTFNLSFSPDGRWVIAEEEGNVSHPYMSAWEAETGKPLQLPERFHRIWFSLDGKRALTLWDSLLEYRINLAAHVWDLETGKPAGPSLDVEEVLAACFSPDGRRVAVAERYRLAVWDVQSGRRLHERYPLQVQGGALAFSPDGKRFAASIEGANSGVQVWDTETGTPVAPRISTSCERLQFTADGRCLLTVAGDTARLWDASTGEPLTPTLCGLGKWQNGIRFSALLAPDGTKLYTRLRMETTEFQVRTLQPEAGAVEDLTRLAAALSGRQATAEGKLEPVPAAELLALRRQVQTQYPARFGPPVARPEDVLTALPDARVSKLLEIVANPAQTIETRNWAIRKLEQIAAREARPALEGLLRDNPSADLRARSAFALSTIAKGEKTVVPALVAALERDESDDVRSAAAGALGRGLARHATGELIHALHGDRSHRVRAAAAAALRSADLKDSAVLAALRVALGDKQPLVRVEVAGTVARIVPDDPELPGILIAELEPARDRSETRYSAVRHLLRLGPRAQDAVPGLIELVKKGQLGRGYRDETAYAVQILGKIGPAAKEAIPVLIDKLPTDESHPNWPNEHGYITEHGNPVAVALSRIGPAIIPDLLRTLKEGKDDHQRIGAVIALGYLGPSGKEALPELEAALKKANDSKKNDWSKDLWHLGVSALKKAIANIRNPDAKPPADPWPISDD